MRCVRTCFQGFLLVLLAVVLIVSTVPPQPQLRSDSSTSDSAGPLMHEGVQMSTASAAPHAPTWSRRQTRMHAAHEPTPSKWKELPEEIKLAYIQRSYGNSVHRSAQSYPATPTETSLTTHPLASSHRRMRAHYSTKPVPENWKELSETDKRAYIRHNYEEAGSTQPKTSY